MTRPVNIYLLEAELHAGIQYDDPASVARGNSAADTLRELARFQVTKEELLELLEREHPASQWAAYHLLEFKELNSSEEDLAVNRINKGIVAGGLDSMGAKMFLDEYLKRKKSRTNRWMKLLQSIRSFCSPPA